MSHLAQAALTLGGACVGTVVIMTMFVRWVLR